MPPRSNNVVVNDKLSTMRQQRMQSFQEQALDLERQMAQHHVVSNSSSSISISNSSTKTKKHGNKKSTTTTTMDSSNMVNTNEAELNRLRVLLCQILAEMMLTDPARAVEWACDERLWRGCFYSKIVPHRTKLQKARKRQRQQQSHQNQQQNQHHQQTVAELETNFLRLLTEGVAFYDYLATNLLKLLQGEPPVHSQEYSQFYEGDDDYDNDASQTTTTTTTTTTQNSLQQQQGKQQQPKPPPQPFLESTNGIVELLYRVHIRRGDLYRYSETKNIFMAQAAYQLAAALGPGQGHAFNQIAVVCQGNTANSSGGGGGGGGAQQQQQQQQQHNQAANALYWYARSLGAATTPFDTSRANLERLFQENHEWLAIAAQQHPQSNVAALAAATNSNTAATAATTTATMTKINNKDAAAAMAADQNHKNKMIRHFLAEFVNLHRYFWVRQDTTTLNKTILSVLDKFGTVMEVSQLGDGLLIKLVCIHAFSEWICQTAAATLGTSTRRGSSGGGGAGNRNAAAFALMARTATFQLATLLAKKFVRVASAKLSWSQQQQSSNNRKPSGRLLLPLLLIFEYLATTEKEKEEDTALEATSSSKARQRYDDARYAFWEYMVQVWNLVAQQFGYSTAAAPDNTSHALKCDDDEGDDELPSEYKSLLGFVPLKSFLPLPRGNDGAASFTPGYVSDEEAIHILQNKNASMASRFCQNSQDCNDKASQAFLVAKRMLRIASRIANSNAHHHIALNDNGEWQWYSQEFQKPLNDIADENEDGHNNISNVGDKEGLVKESKHNDNDNNQNSDEPLIPPDDDDADALATTKQNKSLPKENSALPSLHLPGDSNSGALANKTDPSLMQTQPQPQPQPQPPSANGQQSYPASSSTAAAESSAKRQRTAQAAYGAGATTMVDQPTRPCNLDAACRVSLARATGPIPGLGGFQGPVPGTPQAAVVNQELCNGMSVLGSHKATKRGHPRDHEPAPAPVTVFDLLVAHRHVLDPPPTAKSTTTLQNPFAMEDGAAFIPQPQHPMLNATAFLNSSILNQNRAHATSPSLLDSGLLQNLWQRDSKLQNPFEFA